MDHPTISVVMSCFNGAVYLAESIESIQKQTFEDFEFIIVNDGSTDDSLSVLEKFKRDDSRIIIVNKENTGLADSLNIGLSIARARWIARIDADDLSLPDRLFKQIRFSQTRKGVVLLGAGCIEIDASGKTWRVFRYPTRHKDIVKSVFRGYSIFPHSSAFFSKATALSAGGYRVRLNGAEDIDLWLRMAEKGEISCLSEPLIKLRKHDDSLTAKNPGLFVYALAGLSSYLIRENGLADPVEQDEEKFARYISIIQGEIERYSLKKRKEYLDKIKKAAKEALGVPSLTGVIQFVGTLRSPISLVESVLHRRIEAKVCRTVAKKWESYVEPR